MRDTFSNKEIAFLLRSIAASYTLLNENRFKIIAYQNAAATVEHLNRELYDMWQDHKLSQVPGIGPSISQHLSELFSTGRSKHFDQILKKIPHPVFELMRIPNIGPKTAFKLVKELNLTRSKNIYKDIEKDAKKGKIEKIETFGKKSQEEILQAVINYRNKSPSSERMPLPYAYTLANQIKTYLENAKGIRRIDALGSLRRMVATIGDIDLAIATNNSQLDKQVIEHFIKYPKKTSVDNAGEKKASLIVNPNIRVDLRVQNEKSYGSMLQYFTGSKTHNIKLREYALKKGLSLSEWGIKNVKTGKITEFSDEERFYKFLDLQYIPPEIREGTNEIDLAKNHKIPKLVETSEIKGDVHLHSSYDLKPSHDLGKDSYEEILKKADALGYEYMGFADHNPKQADHSEEQIIEIMKRRKSQIEKLSTKKVKYFIGLEADILPNGNIALPEKAIEFVDYLVISVHSVFTMKAELMTKRVLKALQYPKVKVLGHPTGRLLLKRPGFEMNWQKIFETCVQKNIALEINAWPDRLDLPDILVREAVEAGAKCIIDTDAHAIAQMDGMRYGVSVARRGWCQKSDIINTLEYEKFNQWLRG